VRHSQAHLDEIRCVIERRKHVWKPELRAWEASVSGEQDAELPSCPGPVGRR